MNFTINSNSSVAYALIGSKVNMTCIAQSSPPADFRIGFKGSGIAKAIGQTYIIEAVKITDSGIYECSASNSIGLPVTQEVKLVVVGMYNYFRILVRIYLVCEKHVSAFRAIVKICSTNRLFTFIL